MTDSFIEVYQNPNCLLQSQKHLLTREGFFFFHGTVTEQMDAASTLTLNTDAGLDVDGQFVAAESILGFSCKT